MVGANFRWKVYAWDVSWLKTDRKIEGKGPEHARFFALRKKTYPAYFKCEISIDKFNQELFK